MASYTLVDNTAAVLAAIEAHGEALLDSIGEHAVAAAMDQAPEDSGALKSTIRVEPGLVPLQRIIASGGPVDGGPYVSKEGKTITDVDYDPYQELGTEFQPAQPFLLPGTEKGAAEAVAEMDTL